MKKTAELSAIAVVIMVLMCCLFINDFDWDIGFFRIVSKPAPSTEPDASLRWVETSSRGTVGVRIVLLGRRVSFLSSL